MRKHLLTALIVSSLAVAGCGKSAGAPKETAPQPTDDIQQNIGTDDSASEDMTTQCLGGTPVKGDNIRIVTSLAPMTAIVGELVSGTGISVTGIIPESQNSHEFVPTTADAKVLKTADIVMLNGLKLDDRIGAMAKENAKDGALLCEAGTAMLPKSEWAYDAVFKQDSETPNPHVWLNPPHMLRLISIIKDAITVVAPDTIPIVDDNYVKMSAQINALDQAMQKDLDSVPVRNRTLVTYHPSFAYFARKYKFEIADIIQTEMIADPMATQMSNLADDMVANEVKTIFGSVEFPSGAVAELGKAVGADYSLSLRDDDLPGKPGDATHTWAELMRYDMSTIIKGLGGTPNAVDAVDTKWPGRKDTAVYPQ